MQGWYKLGKRLPSPRRQGTLQDGFPGEGQLLLAEGDSWTPQRESQRNEDPGPPSSYPDLRPGLSTENKSADNMKHRELETTRDQRKRLGRPWRREGGQDP